MKRIAIIFVCLSLCAAASAQRTAKGGMGVSAAFNYPFNAGWGASLGWQYYHIPGMIDAELSATHRRFSLSCGGSTMKLEAYHYLASCGYLFRLAATRDRMLNFYGGGGVVLGAARDLPSDGDWTLYNEAMGMERAGAVTCFAFGVYPKLELEYFFLQTVALDVSCRAPLTIHTKSKDPLTGSQLDNKDIQKVTGVIYPEIRVGLKVNF